MILFLYFESKKTFNEEKTGIEQKYILKNKEQIKEEVNRVSEYINYLQKTTEEELKKSVKSRVYEAHAIATGIYEKYKDTTRAVMIPLQNVSGWGIAMRKNQPELKAKVDAFITKAKTDGTFDKIRDKYLKGQKDEFEKATGMKFFF